MKIRWFGFFVLLVFFFIGVYGCNVTEETVEEVSEEEPVEEEQEITLLEEDFTFKIGTLPYRGAILFIDYEGKENLSDFNLFVDVLSDGEIKQEKIAVEEVDGNLVATIVDLMYLPGDELSFVITIQSNSGEEIKCRYSEILERYPWKDWMLADNEPFFINSSLVYSFVIKEFHYDYQSWRIVGFHPSWDIWTTSGKEVEVYSGTVGIVQDISPAGVKDGYVLIYNPYVGVLLQYGHTFPAEGIFVRKNVMPGELIAYTDLKRRHIHYSTIRPFGYTRWSKYFYGPRIVTPKTGYIFKSDNYRDPFYFHEPTTLGYWYEETLPKGLKDEMLRIFKRDNPGVVLPATESLEPLD